MLFSLGVVIVILLLSSGLQVGFIAYQWDTLSSDARALLMCITALDLIAVAFVIGIFIHYALYIYPILMGR